jgi:hypothetical protein
MLILGTLTILFVLGLILYSLHVLEDLYVSLIAFSGFFFSVGFVLLATFHAGAAARLAEYSAFVNTVAEARANRGMTESERALLTVEISKWNVMIASDRAWNETILDIWIPDVLVEKRKLISAVGN